MRTSEVKDYLRENMDESARTLLLSKMPTANTRFKRLAKSLRGLLSEVNKEFPDACFYTASGGLTLMLGSPHGTETNNFMDADKPNQELIALDVSDIVSIGDGDF